MTQQLGPCGSCVFWHQDPHQLNTPSGYCRRYPPTAIFCGMIPLPPSAIQTQQPQAPKMMPVIQGAYPPSNVDSECGEHITMERAN